MEEKTSSVFFGSIPGGNISIGLSIGVSGSSLDFRTTQATTTTTTTIMIRISTMIHHHFFNQEKNLDEDSGGS